MMSGLLIRCFKPGDRLELSFDKDGGDRGALGAREKARFPGHKRRLSGDPPSVP